MYFKKFMIIAIITALFLSNGITHATSVPTDETALFSTTISPDALIILDLSGSMQKNPSGGSEIYGDTSCSGPFYLASTTGYATDCSKIAIAKRAIFAILDYNGDGTINAADVSGLDVRMGYMRFANGNDTAGLYASGNNLVVKGIGNTYRSIFCNIISGNSGCSITSQCQTCNCGSTCAATSPCINSACAGGGTPLASSLNEAKLYYDAVKLDDSVGCRPRFAILITDGADTYACGGTGTETQSDMYKRRRESVAKAQALYDAGYKLFVVGFGSSIPTYLMNTMEWLAYYGGTDNPLVTNSGSISGYSPSSVTSCADDTTTGTCDGTSTDCFATSNDPGNTALSGYAFIATDATSITSQLNMAINIIREANYSFSQASVQLNRTVDENFIYEGSIQPRTGDPFWFGYLKKYTINSDGTRGGELWDAGGVLATTDASVRNIKTYKSGSIVLFKVPPDGSITSTDLAVADDADRNKKVGFFRGESAYNIEGWKLGDIFRSKPITVGTPSHFFEDQRDENNAFASYRSGHQRASSPYTGRVVLVGANDGQLHAFKTSDGTEAWSFIPPNLLSRLKMIAHNTHPSTLAHVSYVDGPVSVTDAWVPSSWGSGVSKSSSDWQTVLLFGEGQGAGANLWSSSTSCDSGFNQTYTSSYPNYCGYFCLNVTDTLNPTYCGPAGSTTPWVRLQLSSSQAYIGAPWSSPMVGRILVGGIEKWVAFIGGGYPVSGATNSGKGLFVFDLRDGSLLWSYTTATNSSLSKAMPAPPAIVDTDNDGFIDTAYIGDLGSNMWRFKFCLAAQGSSCTTSSWSGGMLYDASASSLRPIYTAATVAKDSYNNIWVYWGTGDKLDPTAANAQEKFFALKDTDRTSTRNLNSMQNVTADDATLTDPTKYGWFCNLTGSGQKILAEPTVFGGVVYFTTFNPANGNNPCQQGGTASLYGFDYTTGAGAINSASGDPVRSVIIGTGIPSAPVVSLRPGNDTQPDLYVTTSGGSGSAASTNRVNINPKTISGRTNIIFWKDTRIE